MQNFEDLANLKLLMRTNGSILKPEPVLRTF